MSCFIEKDHYELCLAEINRITASQLDVVSQSAFTAHLGNENNQCGLLLLCVSAHVVLSSQTRGLLVSRVSWPLLYLFLLNVAPIFPAFLSPSTPDTGCHSHPIFMPSISPSLPLHLNLFIICSSPSPLPCLHLLPSCIPSPRSSSSSS